jgi:hypothetical protein
VKSLELLLLNRKIENIITVDNIMQNFTYQLTNGVYLPSYKVNQDFDDNYLISLLDYLMSFITVSDVR